MLNTLTSGKLATSRAPQTLDVTERRQVLLIKVTLGAALVTDSTVIITIPVYIDLTGWSEVKVLMSYQDRFALSLLYLLTT